MIKINTCFKGEGSCIDFILTRRKFSFRISTSFETESCWCISTDQVYAGVHRIIDSFCFHPSIKNVKRNYKITNTFSLKLVSEEFVKKIVNDLSLNNSEEFVKNIVNDLSLNKADGAEIPLKSWKNVIFIFIFLKTVLMKLWKATSFQAL